MKPIRIACVLPSLRVGGMERIAYAIATTVGPGFTTEFHLFDERGELAAAAEARGFPVHVRARAPGFLDMRLVREMGDAWRESRPDVIHAHNGTAFLYAALASWRAGGIPLVVTEHGRFFQVSHPVHDRALFRVAARNVDRFVVVASWLRDAVVSWGALPESVVEVVPNGIDGEPWIAASGAGVREELGIAPHVPLAACVARLVTVKNHPLLLRAWARLTARRPAALLLVGDGPDRASVEEVVSSLALEKYVLLLGTRSDVPRLLKACDFHVLVSHSEGMSVTLLEAMAAGRASIATAVGGNPDVLTHERTGILVPPDDEDALLGAIERFVERPQDAQEMGAAAAEEFRTRFTLAAMVRAYERVYLEAIAQREGARFVCDAVTPPAEP